MIAVRSLLGVAAIVAQIAAQQAAQPAPVVQPLPYCHKTHLALGLKCLDCHPNPDPGTDMAFPPVAKCMTCHASVAKDHPAIRKLAEFSASKQPIPWVRVYTIPDWVTWSHRSHLNASLNCDGCHGDVAQMEVIEKVTNVTTMAGCVDCHQQKKANTDCSSCHDLGPAN